MNNIHEIIHLQIPVKNAKIFILHQTSYYTVSTHHMLDALVGLYYSYYWRPPLTGQFSF